MEAEIAIGTVSLIHCDMETRVALAGKSLRGTGQSSPKCGVRSGRGRRRRGQGFGHRFDLLVYPHQRSLLCQAWLENVESCIHRNREVMIMKKPLV
jgi:hypothetical protein